MKTVEQEQVASTELALPPSVQEALGGLVCAAKDGLLALSVGVGLGVLSEMMEAELDEVVGPKHAKLAERTTVLRLMWEAARVWRAEQPRRGGAAIYRASPARVKGTSDDA